MRAIRSRDTGPEVRLRRALWGSGVRGYRVADKHLPGRPDLTFARARIAVFVDGCFFHRCPTHCRMPASRRQYWEPKLAANVARDTATTAKLRWLGWRVIRVWEHDDPVAVAELVTSALQATPTSNLQSPRHRAAGSES